MLPYRVRWRGLGSMLSWAVEFVRRRVDEAGKLQARTIHELVGAVWRDGYVAGDRARIELVRERLGLGDDAEERAAAALAELEVWCERAEATERMIEEWGLAERADPQARVGRGLWRKFAAPPSKKSPDERTPRNPANARAVRKRSQPR